MRRLGSEFEISFTSSGLDKDVVSDIYDNGVLVELSSWV